MGNRPLFSTNSIHFFALTDDFSREICMFNIQQMNKENTGLCRLVDFELNSFEIFSVRNYALFPECGLE